MLAVVRHAAGPRALVRTLASLVRGVVEGDLGAVVIAARPDDDDALRIAEESGAAVLAAQSWPKAVVAAAGRAGTGWLLVIDGGVVPGESFWPELQEVFALGETGPFVTRPAAEGLAAWLARRLAGRISPDQAVIGRAEAFGGDPWEGGLHGRPRRLRTATFRPGAGLG